MSLREAAQQALEALEAYPFEDATKRNVYAPVIIMLKGALAEPERKPLTDEEIDDIWNRYCDELGEASINDAHDIVRAIERAHGIGGEA